MYKYTAYGLVVDSEIPLPELPAAENDSAEVTIKYQKIDWAPPECSQEIRYWQIEMESVYFFWKYGGKFLVRGGTEIIVDPIPNLEANYIIRPAILGPLLGIILHQRNYLILHGSGIRFGDRARIFLGNKGQGKSTIAATLVRLGHQMIVDDIAAITFNESGDPILLPGFPQIKLWPDAVKSALGDNPESFRKIHPLVEKRARPTWDNFCSKSVNLERVYILKTGSNLGIQNLNTQEAIKELIANSYIPMTLGNKFTQLNNISQHLSHCADIVNKIPICSLERSRSLDSLPEVAYLVKRDLSRVL